METLYINNTMILSLTGLADDDGAYQNSATVTLVSLVDKNGTDVSGISYPLTLSYVSASNGNYEVNIPADIGVVPNGRYKGVVRAVSGSLQFEATVSIMSRRREP